MANGNTKDVNLVIKAKQEAKRAIDSVSDALKVLQEAQDSVTKSASKTDSVLAQLGDELSNLSNTTKGLGALGTIAEQLDKAARSVSNLEQQVSKSAEEIKRLEAESASAGSTTATLTSDIERQTKALLDQQAATKAAKEAQTKANAELRAAETVLKTLERRAANSKQPTDNLATQIQAQKQLVAQLKDQQQAATSNFEKQKKAQADAATTLKALNVELSSSEAQQKRLASATTSAADQLARQSAQLDTAKSELGEISTIAGRASTALGGVALTQDAIAEASRKASSEIQKVATALQNQKGGSAVLKSAGVAAQAAATDVSGTATVQASQRSVAAYKAQVQAVAEAKAAYEAARAEATKLGAVTGEMTQDQQRAFVIARANAKAAKEAYVAEGVALAELRGRANSTFAEFSRGATLMEQSAAATRNAASSLKTVQSSLAPIRPAAEQTRTSFDRFKAALLDVPGAMDHTSNSSREALSFFQRLRGEVLALTTAYLGLQAAVTQIQAVIEAYRNLQTAQTRLSVVFNGDQTKVSNDLGFLKDQADRLGISFSTLADQYSKFAVAANEAGFSIDSIRRIFLSVAEAARTNNLNLEETNGIFLALTQMISKGKISAQELRQQMGERLPGAFNIFADALGMTTAKLDELMSKGDILASESNMVKFADELTKKFGPQLGQALANVSTEIGRLQNNVFNAQLTAGKAGFIDALNAGLKELNTYLASEDGEKFFQSLGAALGRVTTIIAEVVKHFDELKLAVEAFLAIKIGSSLATGLVGLSGSLQQATAGFTLIGPRTREAAEAQSLFSRAVAFSSSSLDVYRTNLMATTSSSTIARTSTVAFSLSLGALNRTMLTVAAVARGMWAAIGGIPGLVLTGLTVAVGAWLTSIDDASNALEVHKKQLEAISNAYDAAKGKAGDWAKTVNGVTLAQALNTTDNLKNEFNKLVNSAGSLRNVLRYAFQDFPDETPQARQFKQLSDAIDGLMSGKGTLKDLTSLLNEIALNPADQQLKEVALQILDMTNVSKDGSASMQELSDAIAQSEAKARLLAGTATEADRTLLHLGETTADTTSNVKTGTAGYDAYNAAIEKISESVPALAEKMKEMKKYQVVDDAYLKGLEAIGQMGIKSSAGIDELLRRLRELRDLAKDSIDASELIKGLDKFDVASDKAVKLITSFEGFKSKAYVDNDGRYRVGYGSDTQTSATGVISQTTAKSVSTVEDALRDLNRRIGDYMDAIRSAIGEDKFAQLSEGQKAVLASLVHNYGTLPERIVNALKTGDTQVTADAIRGLGTDNNGINAGRRGQEAAIFQATSTADDVDFQIKKLDEAKKKQDEFNTSFDEHVAGLKAEADARAVSNREGTIAKALAEEEEKARKAGLPVLENGSRLTRDQAQALREVVGARYDAMHSEEEHKKQQQEEQDAIQNLIGLDQQRKTSLQELQMAMNEGDYSKVEELRAKIEELNKEIADAIPNALKLAEALGDERGVASLQKIELHAKQVKTELFNAAQINQMFAEGLTNAFASGLQSIGQAIVGAKSWKEALLDVRNAFLKFAGDFLIEIGKMILKQAILNALQGGTSGSGGGSSFGSIISSALNAMFHGGGTVGGGNGQMVRSGIMPELFANAMRYHGGGLPGLKSDEVATILKRNEEVLSDSDPRNILNGGAAADGSNGSQKQGEKQLQPIRNILVFDENELAAALNSAAGEKVILQHVKRNAPTIKRMIGA